MVSLMYSVATYTGNSVLNYNLNYNSLLCLGYCKLILHSFSKVYAETCWLQHITAIVSSSCWWIWLDWYNTSCEILYLHKCTKQNKQYVTLFIWLLDLVSFCYYTVVGKNCIQADAKFKGNPWN